MRRAILRSIGLLVLAAMGASPASAGYYVPPTLRPEKRLVLLCTVSEALTAKDCGPQQDMPRPDDGGLKDFLALEAQDPDYLAGATPGARVLVMVRRSLSAPIDGANPGRAPLPTSPAIGPIMEPDWAIMPPARAFDGYVPDRLMRMGASGSVTARCTVGARGDLLGCWIAAENPSDMGLGWSTLMLSTFVKMKPIAKDGSPTAGRTYVLQANFNALAEPVIALSSGH